MKQRSIALFMAMMMGMAALTACGNPEKTQEAL